MVAKGLKASQKAEIKVVRHTALAVHEHNAGATVATSTATASANRSTSIGALSALDQVLDQVGKPKRHTS